MHRFAHLNSAIDIIPLQQCSTVMSGGDFSSTTASKGDNSNANKRRQPQQQQSSRMQDDGFSGRDSRDPQLIPRVRQYLYENEDKVYIDVNAMADSLQRKYRDYRSKNRNVFRAKVRKAYDEITENLVKHTEGLWQDDDEIDLESEAAVEALAPQLVQASYKRPASNLNGNSSDKELIDISSDDESPQANETLRSNKSSEVVHPAKKPNLGLEHESSKPFASIQKDSFNKYEAQPHSPKIIRPYERHGKKKSHQRIKGENEFGTGQSGSHTNQDLPVSKPVVQFSDIGGNSKVLETVVDLLVHIKHPEVYSKIGILPPRGILLHGPPGCGKTLLAHAIAGEMKIPLLKVAAPELIAGVSGESESKIRDLFEQAAAIAPCILFLDEIDSIAPHRITAQKEMEKRIVSQLLTSLDDMSSKNNGNRVLVLGATSRPDAIDPALRSAGRFDREISLGIPDKDTRKAILEVHTKNVSLSPDVNLEKIASLTPGFVGADLVALIREAALAAVHRAFADLQKAPSGEPELKKTQKIQALPDKQKTELELVTVEEKESKEDEVKSTENDQVNANVDEVKESETSENSKSQEKETPVVEEVPAEISTSKDQEPEPIEEMPVQTENQTTEESGSKISTDQITKNESAGSEPMAMSVDDGNKKNITVKLAWLQNEPPMSEDQLADLCIQAHDFDLALKNVQPSAKREGFATVPDVTWNDVGSLQDVRQELQMTILAPIRHAERFEKFGLSSPTGLLLCGPPGCGKTLIAKAIANEAGINFISVKGPELLNMYVGESEKAVRQCFIRAKNSAPCVIFFDELDALCPKRSEGDSSATARVVNQMLTEMDGVEGRKGVFLMAASNRPDIIDPAILRPGRLDKILYVGLPNVADRVDIIRALTKNGTQPTLATDVDLQAICSSERCEGYTGADLAALVREASTFALRDVMKGLQESDEVCARHFQTALEKVKPSVQDKDKQRYEKFKKMYSLTSCDSDITPMETPEDPPVIGVPMEAMET